MIQSVAATAILLALATTPWAQTLPASPSPPDSTGDGGMVLIDNFFIDVYEYPNQRGALPTVDVTFGQAEELCQAAEKRLCTEQEWQRAATGPENYPYGYGETFESGRCNTPQQRNGEWMGGAGLAPSGAFAQCSNSYGLHDMIGNAWEWTASWYSQQQRWRAVRGGSYFHNANMARTDARYGRFLDGEYHLDLIGFRCCRTAAGAPANPD